MKSETLEIRKIRKDEISFIKELQPSGWNSDLEKVYNQHYEQDYFYPIIALINTEIVGTGVASVNDSATWLGNIIVKEGRRDKGIGSAITNHLINYSKTKGNGTIILTASELGLPVYKKIGFQHDINYLFFKSDHEIRIDSVSKHISPVVKSDYAKIFELDHSISGERRLNLLTLTLRTGFKYKEDKIEGFYLPDFGNGHILANSEIAGIELLKYRYSLNTSSICVPETNLAAIDFFKSLGLYQYLKAPRLFLNKNVNWNPQNVYSRGCGYLG
jgi:ribosomal protein S18 acetylase RimI-like enzyme